MNPEEAFCGFLLSKQKEKLSEILETPDSPLNYATLCLLLKKTPCFFFIKHCDFSLFSLFFHKFENFIEVNEKDENGITIFMWTLLRNDKKIIEILLFSAIKAKIDINVNDNFGLFPLMFLLNKNENLLLKNMLFTFKSTININKSDETGVSLLIRAISLKNHEIFTEITTNFAEKININHKDVNGNTAFHWSVYKRNIGICEEIIRIFIEKIDVFAINSKGKTVFMVICEEGFYEGLLLFLKKFKEKAEINKKDANGNSAIALALGRGHAKIVGVLMKEFKGEITGAIQSKKVGIGLVDLKI